MSFLDKAVAAVTPEPSEDDKREARSRLRSGAAATSGWTRMVLDHHEQIESAFAAVKSATTASGQRAEQKKLATLLTGHSLAEDAVLYPAMALTDQKAHATTAYTQQSTAKIQVAALEELEPLSKDYLDKLEHLRAAVSHHVYEEESKWFPKLCEAESTLQTQLTARYEEEFGRYMKGGGDGADGVGRPGGAGGAGTVGSGSGSVGTLGGSGAGTGMPGGSGTRHAPGV